MELIIVLFIILLILYWCNKQLKKEMYSNPVVLGLKYPKIPNSVDFTWEPYSGYNYDIALKYFY